MSAVAVRPRLRSAEFGDDHALGEAMQAMEGRKRRTHLRQGYGGQALNPESIRGRPTAGAQPSTLNYRRSVSQLSTLNSQLSSLRHRSGRDLRGSAEAKRTGAGRDRI